MVEITRADSWDAVRAAHRWDVPARYNLAHDLCGKWAAAEPDRLALVHVTGHGAGAAAGAAAGGVRDYSHGALWRLSARLANVLAAHGVARGDRVGVLLPQAPEVVVLHLAAYRIGAIVVPLFTQFGADALQYRLADSGAKVIVTDAGNLPKIAGIRAALPALAHVWLTDGPGDGSASLPQAMEAARDEAPVADTGPEDPAFISYTSGTTGPPKGALHGHRVALGHIPGVQLFYDFWPQPGDRIWTPSDWAWLGGLGNVMMPSLRMGVPLVVHTPRRFDAGDALRLIADHRVTTAFLAPTALKLMRQLPAIPPLPLRAVGSGGESLGAAVLEWGREAFGFTINELYGQTECNLVLGNCARIMAVRPGSMGRPVPGKQVAVLSRDGSPCAPDEVGEIAVRRGDPAMFLRYWRQPERTAEKFVPAEDGAENGAEWLLTGDEGRVDADGYFWFSSRTDDVITSSGYRVGPSEIEDCLNRHPAVAMSACIGVPDPVRGEVIRAHVVLVGGREGSPELADELRTHVRSRLSPHLTPREIEWTEDLPMTSTGKIMRRALRRQ